MNVDDINFDRALVHVRKGKNYKERFVPISKASLKYIQDYVYDHRAALLQGNKSESFFARYNEGRRVHGQTIDLAIEIFATLGQMMRT